MNVLDLVKDGPTVLPIIGEDGKPAGFYRLTPTAESIAWQRFATREEAEDWWNR
jgi:hypothetical protein